MVCQVFLLCPCPAFFIGKKKIRSQISDFFLLRLKIGDSCTDDMREMRKVLGMLNIVSCSRNDSELFFFAWKGVKKDFLCVEWGTIILITYDY